MKAMMKQAFDVSSVYQDNIEAHRLDFIGITRERNQILEKSIQTV